MPIKKLKQHLSNRFIRNAGWLGFAELLNRIFRLGTTIVLARSFGTYDYGLLAILYTVHSFAEVFTSKVGIGAKIVQTEQEHLEAVCNTAYWMSWMLCAGIFLVQCLMAFPIAWFYQDNQLILPVCIVGLKYLIIPTFKIQSSRLKRDNRFKIHAISNVAESLSSNAITIVLALLGLGIWSVVWAMVISCFFRGAVYHIYDHWKPPKSFHLEHWQEVIHFGGNMLGIGLLDRFRGNLDYLIVGKFLTVEALGVYFFAFNAGIGISQNVINALISSLFPHLCEVRENLETLKKRYVNSLKLIAIAIIPLVLLQSSLAPIYVPIVFGQQWLEAVPILSVVCLSAIPLAFALASYQLLNAVGQIKITLIWNVIYTILLAIVLLIAVQWGVFEVAVSVFLCQILTLFFSVWATRYVFKKAKVSTG